MRLGKTMLLVVDLGVVGVMAFAAWANGAERWTVCQARPTTPKARAFDSAKRGRMTRFTARS